MFSASLICLYKGERNPFYTIVCYKNVDSWKVLYYAITLVFIYLYLHKATALYIIVSAPRKLGSARHAKFG